MKRDFKKYLNPVFVETGSYTGEGINNALNAGFSQIYSIELSNYYFNLCKDKFKNNNNVEIISGDSINVLPNLLSKINERCTFWLDGHYSGGNTACGIKPVPLYEELEIIAKHSIKTHTILIDDIRLLRDHQAEWSNLEYNINDIEELIKEINSDYNINYIYGMVENDILVAEI